MKIFRQIGLLTTLMFCSAFASQAASSDAGARLDQLMKGLQSLQAEFRQIVKDSQGRTVEESKGELAILRPNRFRWDYREPHEQVIVADGTKLWLYDKDLEQVTVRRMDTSIAGTPAMLLSGEGDMKSSFKIEDGGKRNGVEWLTLTPIRSDTEFKRVRLGVRNDTLVGMELFDKLGQVTRLDFSNVQRNPTFAKDRFTFAPPPGVDVIGGKSAADTPPAEK